MREAGVELWADLHDLAVMGFTEVLQRWRSLRRIEARLLRVLTEDRPDLVVLIDYPGLNLRMARAAHALGLRVLYTIAPKAWAWRASRARTLAETTDRVALVLPFEPEFFAPYGVRFSFVGHPLLDRADDVPTREAWRERWGLDPDRPILALLPGSRPQEIRHHVPAFAEIAKAVSERRRDVLPVFSRAESVDATAFDETGIPVAMNARALLRHADAALVASGTATLEAALEGTPHVIAYRTSAASAFLARRMMTVEHVGLPNLVAGKAVVPEFLQDEVRPGVVAPALVLLLDPESDARVGQKRHLATVASRLGTPGAAGRVAELAAELIQEAIG